MGDSVGHVMPSQVLTTSPQSNIGEIDRIMDGQKIHGLQVDEKKKFVGIISRADILTAITQEADMTHRLAAPAGK